MFPNQLVTTYTGYFSTSSVSRLARRLWNNRGQGSRPARLKIFPKVVRRLAFIQPALMYWHSVVVDIMLALQKVAAAETSLMLLQLPGLTLLAGAG